jgi:hypothetical protein
MNVRCGGHRPSKTMISGDLALERAGGVRLASEVGSKGVPEPRSGSFSHQAPADLVVEIEHERHVIG